MPILEEQEQLLPIDEDSDIGINSSPTPRQVLRIALNLKYLIDQVVPIQFNEDLLTSPFSEILTSKVVQLAREAAGGKGNGKINTSSRKYRAVLIFCLLKVSHWYQRMALSELQDSDLYTSRNIAAQQIAKIIIEEEEDEHYLFIEMLCRRYTINLNDKDSDPASALELSVDLHSTIVIGSSGYQKCVKWIWRGWIVQSDKDPTKYELYTGISKPGVWNHYDADRIKTPKYQNMVQIFISVIYLVIYSVIVNSLQYDSYLDFWETVFYLFTLSFVIDEFIKLYHIGYNYTGFWNVFNDTMYAIIITGFSVRIAALSKDIGSPNRFHLNEVSFRILSCAAPLMWSRLLLFLDSERFVGALLVVLKVLFKESVIFFFLLIVVIIGFLQAFLGLDSADGKRDITKLLLRVMFTTVIGEGDIDSISNFTSPYGELLYYFYSFSVTVILLNILVALYNTAYENIIENANDEYLALVAQKTLRYVRAPDENVFVPPLNLIEVFGLVLPFSWWMKYKTYQDLNDKCMLIIYAPLLLYVAIKESKDAKRVQYNRINGFGDDSNETDQEWDLEDGYDSDDLLEGRNVSKRVVRGLRSQRLAENEDPEFQANKNLWKEKVGAVAPPLEAANDTGIKWDQYGLYKELYDLKGLVKDVLEENRKLREELKKNQ